MCSPSLQSGSHLPSWYQAWLLGTFLPQGSVFHPQAFAFLGKGRKMQAGYCGWIFPWGSEAMVMPARAACRGAMLGGACERLQLEAGSRQGGSVALLSPCVFLMLWMGWSRSCLLFPGRIVAGRKSSLPEELWTHISPSLSVSVQEW